MLGTDQNHLINPRHCTASARPRARVGRARSAVAGELPLSGIVHARAPKTLLKCVGVPKPAAKFAPTCRTSRGLEIRLRLPPHRLKTPCVLEGQSAPDSRTDKDAGILRMAAQSSSIATDEPSSGLRQSWKRKPA